MSALKRINKLFVQIVLSLFLQNCGGVNLKDTNKSPYNKLSESFFIGNGVSQYHIKSQELSSNFEDSENSFDATFRKNEADNTLCNINLTVISNFKIEAESDFNLIVNNTTIESTKTTVIYNENANDKIVNRISTKVEYASFLKAMNTDNFQFVISNKENTITLKPSKKTLKNIAKLRQSFLN